MKSNKTKIIHIRLTESDYADLTKALESSNISRSEFVRDAIKRVIRVLNNAKK